MSLSEFSPELAPSDLFNAETDSLGVSLTGFEIELEKTIKRKDGGVLHND